MRPAARRFLPILLLIPGLLLASVKPVPKVELIEATFGARLPLRDLSAEQKRAFEKLIRLGYLKDAPTKIHDEPPISVRRLSDEEKIILQNEIGKSFAKLSSPVGARNKKGPMIPHEVRGKIAQALCVFEVRTDGSVGRVFATESTNDTFFLECAWALTQWEFEPQNELRFFRILFRAES